MRVGYGYNRDEKTFAHARIDTGRSGPHIFIDSKATDRSERAEMFLLLKPGDTVVLLFKGDLARGAHSYDAVWDRINRMGVSVEICPPPGKDSADTRPPGRPAGFDPAPEHDEEIRLHWHDVEGRPGRYAIKVAKRLGYDVKEHQLRHRYGKRGDV